jgi:Leucine-rich repeat (LRR) protein
LFKGRNFVGFAKFEKYKFEPESIECNSTGRIRNGSGNFDKNNSELILKYLQSVNVEHNSIGKVPFGIFAKAIQLSKLNFKENELTAFPLDFGTWLPLTELNVSNNEIHELPAGKLFRLN